MKPFRQSAWEYNGQVSKHSVTPNIGIPVSVKRGLRTADFRLRTGGKINADCRLKVKCRLGVKCRKNHIRAKIREMSSRKQNASRFLFSLEPRDFVTQRYPCSAERGTRLTRPDEEHSWEACYVYTIYSTNSADFGHWAWKIQTWRTTNSMVYLKWTLCSIDLLLFSEMHIRQKFQWTSEQLKFVYLDLQYFR